MCVTPRRPARRIPELQTCHGIAIWTCFGAPSASDLTACTAFWRLFLWRGGLSMSRERARRREARAGARSGRRGSVNCLMPFRIILRDIASHFFMIFGCGCSKYIILTKSVFRRIWAPDRALDGRWNVEKRGPKYVLLSTDFSDDFWHQNGPVRAPSETRNAPPGSPGWP